MRQLAPLLKKTMETAPQGMERGGISPGLLDAHIALASSFLSPFDGLALLEESIRGYRQRLAGLSRDAPEHADQDCARARAVPPLRNLLR